MPRSHRIVLPHRPHHVTQRGNRRQPVFFGDDDYRLYRKIVADQCRIADVRVWAYCLLPNHIHLMLVPETSPALTVAVGEAHRRYTTAINKRERWTGYLWQGRYGSQPFTHDAAICAVARYIELNPVEAGLVARPDDWPWSSARSHLRGDGDPLLDDAELRAMVPDWADLLREGT